MKMESEIIMKNKNWKGKFWVKLLALMVASVTFPGTILGFTGFIFCISLQENYEGDRSDIRQEMTTSVVENYGMSLLNQLSDEDADQEEVLKQLSGRELFYKVEEISFKAKEGLATGEGVVGETMTLYDTTEGVEKGQKGITVSKNKESYGQCTTNSFWQMATHGTYTVDDGEEYSLAQEEGKDVLYRISYNESTTDEADYYIVPGEYTFYRITLFPDEGKNEQLAVSAVQRAVGGLNHGRTIDDLTFIDLLRIMPKMDKMLNYWNFEDDTPDYLWVPYLAMGMYHAVDKMYTPLLVVSLILFAISFGILMTVSGHREEDDEIHTRFIDRVPYVIYFGIVATGVALGASGNIGLIYLWYSGSIDFYQLLTLSISLGMLWTMLGLAFCMSTATRIKTKEFMRYTLLGYIWRPIKNMFSSMKDFYKEKTRFGVRLAIFLLILFIVEAIGISATLYSEAIFVLFFLYKIVETFVIYYLAIILQRLYDGGQRVASGNYHEPIDTTKMPGALKAHGEDINRMGEGIALAVEEQMKSERMKTELITNVSHDIKTPLTSIINYVDLMKKEEVDNEKVQEYIEVLDRQSARLKKLIVDLIDASKASTGNVEVNLETCDLAVMVSQAVGEYEDKFKEHGLDVVINVAEGPTSILADGRHLWRVLDNVTSNINKYAQDNTRVYVDIQPGLHHTKVIFKNISKYQLNITSEELMERFVRGDSSRNTDGHGLGLSIAQSLSELMGGGLELEIDGDLFKAIVTLKR